MTDKLNIRPARTDDGEILWQWRNDPDVRRASLTSAEIPLADHLAWFGKALEDPNREIFIAEHDGQPIGMVRFDKSRDAATVSILLASGHRGKGLARPVLSGAIAASGSGTGKLRALVKPDNAASLALFHSLGFTAIGDGDTTILERKPEAQS